MSETQTIATVFGGTGFIGRQIVRGLAKKGYTIKVATRVPESAFFLRPCGTVGQIVPFAVDYSDVAGIARAVEGADLVVNCIGILHECGKGQFKKIHAELPGIIAGACARAGTARFIHLSTAGIETGNSRYAKTKLEGERAVRAHYPGATIIKPSIVFGPDDEFFNKFARLMRLLPYMPLIGGGQTKFQPVFVGDVANAVMRAAEDPATAGKSYELGGPEIVSFREIYRILTRYTGYRPRMIKLSWGLAKAQAFFMGLLPNPMLTRDQVESLKSDCVVADGALTLADLGVNATAMDVILPAYLESYRAGGKFGAKRPA